MSVSTGRPRRGTVPPHRGKWDFSNCPGEAPWCVRLCIFVNNVTTPTPYTLAQGSAFPTELRAVMCKIGSFILTVWEEIAPGGGEGRVAPSISVCPQQH